ncbi:hypothetical protein AWV79_00430 [Cupriavidus sp. UYMMa02A]|nr:hypothetical protein AWV79_00430 [Cupriavidus sp. UYMMa02A]
MRIASRIVLSDTERAELEAVSAATAGNLRLAQRARMILLARRLAEQGHRRADRRGPRAGGAVA